MSEHIKHDYLASETNPNGLFDIIMDKKLERVVKDPRERLVLATADINSFLVNVVGVDPDMASVVAARATQEVTHALLGESAPSHEVMGEIVAEGVNRSAEVSVDRAIDLINESE